LAPTEIWRRGCEKISSMRTISRRAGSALKEFHRPVQNSTAEPDHVA
jgi:hypothetical protein